MAKDTNVELRNKLVYQVFNRNHNETGTFNELVSDLDRIKDLGTDYVYLLPIHEIGKLRKKGNLGCPYSIKDYYTINPEYGTLEDFKNLINEVHKRDMKILIDIVFNHTSHDSIMLDEYEHLYFKRDGELANRVGDWWDITDLDYTKEELHDVMIDILKYFTNLGIDGYRCDVASMLPLDFWLKARKEVKNINSDSILIAESVHASFVTGLRNEGIEVLSDSEVFQAFDVCYDYDVQEKFIGQFTNENNTKAWIDALKFQEAAYPNNYVKLRNLENHDQPRINSLVYDDVTLRNYTALNSFLKGMTMIYAGQEARAKKRPDLFDTDKVDWSELENSKDIQEIITKISKLKKSDDIFIKGAYEYIDTKHDGLVHIVYRNEDYKYHGIFNLRNISGQHYIGVGELPRGAAVNILSGDEVQFLYGGIILPKEPVIFKEYIEKN